MALPPGRNYAPVNVAVWDSGVDTALFPGRVVMDGGKPAVIAFDLKSDPRRASCIRSRPTSRAASRR